MKKVYKVDYWSKGNAKLSYRTVSRKYLEKYITENDCKEKRENPTLESKMPLNPTLEANRLTLGFPPTWEMFLS